ncbi:MAG: phage tail tape measure protein family, partial [Capsulimonas sp.]|nr:phage tail tape measure protein family [Capsulimonas sp.]
MSSSINLGTISAGVELNVSGLKQGGAEAKAALASVSAEMKKATDGIKTTMAGVSADMKKTSAAIKSSMAGVSGDAEKSAAKTTGALGKVGKGFQELGSTVKKATSAMSKDIKKMGDSEAWDHIGNKAGLAGAAVAAGLGAAAKTAGDFDQSLRNVDSIAHLSEQGFKDLHDSVMKLADDKNIRATPQELATGLYDIYSSGFKGAKAMEILRISAEGASAGMTDTATSSKALMAVLNSGISGVQSEQQAMDVLVNTVNEGVLTFEELATGIGAVLPLAASAGISLQEVGAAVAVMTKGGLSAGQSFDDLNQYIQQMLKPSAEAAKEMDKLGIKYGMAHLKAVGLGGSIQEVIEKTKGHEDSLAALFPNLQSFIAFLSTSKNAGHDMTAELDSMNRAGDGVGQMMESLIRQNKGASQQFKDLKKATSELGVEVGEELLPYLLQLAKTCKGMLDDFRALPKPVKDTAVGFVAIFAAVSIGLKGIVGLARGLKDIQSILGGSMIFKGLQGLLKALGTRLAAGTLGGLLTTAGAGSMALGGGVVVAGGALLGGLGKAIAGEQIDAANQQARGDAVADVSIYINKLAAIRKAHPKDYAKRNDYVNTQETLRRMSGSMDRNGVPTSDTSAIGAKIANAAWTKQLGLDRVAYNRRCARLARETVQSITPAFDKIWDRSENATAITNLRRFQKAGLARKYTPGMALPPGALLFSTTLGGGSGHVQTIAGGGRRMDQHGVNHFGLNNFQWFVPPPGAPGSGKAAAPKATPLTDEQKKANQQVQDELFENTHGKFENDRHQARRKYQERLSDPTVTDKKAAKLAYLAELKSIDKEESKELAQHHKQAEEEQKRHLAEIKRQQKEHHAANLARQKQANAHANNVLANQYLKGVSGAIAGFSLKNITETMTALNIPAMLATADVKKQGYDASHNGFDVARDNVFRDAQKSREDGVDENTIAERMKADLARIHKEQTSYSNQLDQQATEFHRQLLAQRGEVDSAYYEGLKQQARDEAAEQIKSGADVETANRLLTSRLQALDTQRAEDVRQTEDEKQAYLYRTLQITLKQYLAYLEMQRAANTQNLAAWRAYNEQILDITRQTATDAYNVWRNTLAGIGGAMGSAVAQSIEHWKGFKNFFQSIMQGVLSAFAQAVGQMVAKWATLQLLGGPDSKSGKGLLSSTANLLSGFKNMFKSVNASMVANIAGIYGAMAALGSMGKKKQRGSI